MSTPTPSNTKKRNLISASALGYSFHTPAPKKARPPSNWTTPQFITPARNAESSTHASDAGHETPSKAGPGIDQDVSTPRRKELRPIDFFSTPFKPQSSKKQHRLNDLTTSPMPRGKGKEVEKDLRGFTELAIPRLEGRKDEEVRRVQEEGVSPSKRVLRHGLSHTLAILVAKSSSSLSLFYTALHHTLNPSQRNTIPIKLKPVSPLQHLRSASVIHLLLLYPVTGPTHNSTMFWCRILRDRDVADHSAGTVLILFQSVPNECPRIGLDPRMLLAHGWDQNVDKRFEVGVWGPWDEVEIPGGVDGEIETGRKVLMVSRYLVAEGER